MRFLRTQTCGGGPPSLPVSDLRINPNARARAVLSARAFFTPPGVRDIENFGNKKQREHLAPENAQTSQPPRHSQSE